MGAGKIQRGEVAMFVFKVSEEALCVLRGLVNADVAVVVLWLLVGCLSLDRFCGNRFLAEEKKIIAK